MKIDLNKKHIVSIRSIIRARLGDLQEEEQEDLLNNIWLELIEIGEIKGKYGEASLMAFIGTVTRRRCDDYLKKLYKKPTKEIRAEKRKKPLLDNEELLKLVGILRMLGIKHFGIYIDDLRGMSRKEISEKRNKSEQQIKGNLEYTKKKIEKYKKVFSVFLKN